MAGVLLAASVSALYNYSKNVNVWLLFFVLISFGYITMSGYLSYFSFHVLTPNGGQNNYHKLKYYNSKKMSTIYLFDKKWLFNF